MDKCIGGNMKEKSIYVNGKLVFKGYNVFSEYYRLCEIYGDENVKVI